MELVSFNDVAWVNLADPDVENTKRSILNELGNNGLIFIRNVKSDIELAKVATILDGIPRLGKNLPGHSHVTAIGVETIHSHSEPISQGFTREELIVHVDGSCFEVPFKYLLMTMVNKASKSGGLSTFVNGRELVKLVKSKDQELYEMLTDCKSVLFRQDDGNFKPLPVFQMSTGPIPEPELFHFRFDENIAFVGPIAKKLPILFELINRLQIKIDFKDGEGYVLNNRWWLHGRTAFEGDRKAWRLLIH